MTAGAAFVTTVQTVVGLKAGWASTDVLAAAVVLASRLAEEDVPRGSPQRVARAAVELVDFAIGRAKEGAGH